MGIADRNPGQLVPFNCASANVAEGAVLVMGATNDVVKLPTAASINDPSENHSYGTNSE